MKLNKKYKLRSIVCGMVLTIGMLCSLVFTNIGFVFAESSFTNPLSNPTFKQSSSSNYVAGVSGWSTISYDGYDSGNYSSGSVKRTAVQDAEDESDKDLWDDFKLVKAPTSLSESTQTDEDTYLMINSYNDNGRLGYKTSSKFNLDANSYYTISVTYQTITAQNDYGKSDSFASIYLKCLSMDSVQNNAKFENLTTSNAWDERTFYIETSPYTSESLELQLWLGGENQSAVCRGAVFFNEVKINKYTENSYKTSLSSAQANSDSIEKVLSLKDYIALDDKIENASFENGTVSEITDWTQIGTASKDDIISQVDLTSYSYKNILAPKTNGAKQNHKGLFMFLEESGSLSLQSSTFELKPSRYYLISVWAKSSYGTSNGSSIQLVKINNDDSVDETFMEKFSVATSETTDTYRNNWTKYGIYVHTDNFVNVKLALRLNLINEGYVFFDDIEVLQISEKNYSSGSSNSNYTSKNLLKNQTNTVTNSSFDVTSFEGNELVYPLNPTNWTLNSHNDYEDYFAGVINVGEINSIKNNYPNLPLISNYKTNITNNNVLVMGAENSNTNLTYTSDKITLSADTKYLLQFQANAQYSGLTSTSKVAVKIYNENSVLYEIENIDTVNWEQYSLYISTGLFSGDYYIDLIFNNTNGYIFFDEITIKTVTSIPTTDISNNIYTVDLNTSLLSYLDNWNITVNDANCVTYVEDGILEINSLDGNNLTLKTKNSITLSANSFYKISILLKTNNLEYETDGGIKIALLFNDNEDAISGIVEEDNFEKYTFYIKTSETDTDINIIIGFGDSDNLIAGEAQFSNLDITKIEDEDTFDVDYNLSSNTSDHVKKIEISSVETEDDDEDDENSDNSNESSVNIWMAISSSITAVALIIALVGVAIRKINWKKPTSRKKNSSNYDRRKTLDKAMDRKERLELRKQLLEEKYSELNNEINSFNEYKNSIEKEIDNISEQVNIDVQKLKEELKQIDEEQDKISIEHNSKIAEDKRATTTAEDKEYNKQIAMFDKKENEIKNKIDKLEASAEKKISKLNFEVELKKMKQEDIQSEIDNLKEEINDLSSIISYSKD